MAIETKRLIKDSTLEDIANSIRAKSGITTELTPAEMVEAINDITTSQALPTLKNEGTAADLLANKQLLDDDGNVVTGTMKNNGAISTTMDGITTKSVTVPAGYTSGGTVSLTDDIDNEVDTQADLISQIATTLEGKAGGGIPSNYEDVGTETSAYTTKLASLESAITALETELEGKASGGSGGGSIETCTIHIKNQCVSQGAGYTTYAFVCIENGEISNKYYDGTLVKESETIIENVLCGSIFYIDFVGYGFIGYTPSGGVTQIMTNLNQWWEAPLTGGSTGVLTIFDDD